MALRSISMPLCKTAGSVSGVVEKAIGSQQPLYAATANFVDDLGPFSSRRIATQTRHFVRTRGVTVRSGMRHDTGSISNFRQHVSHVSKKKPPTVAKDVSPEQNGKSEASPSLIDENERETEPPADDAGSTAASVQRSSHAALASPSVPVVTSIYTAASPSAPSTTLNHTVRHPQARPDSFSRAAEGDDDAKRLAAISMRRAAFKRALLMATVHPIGSGCELIKLPPTTDGKPVHWLGLRSNVLFVRPIFRTMYERMFCNVTNAPMAEFNKLLRGVSGSGKSSFGLCVLWRLAKEGRNVLYEYPRGLAVGAPIVFGSASDFYIADACEPSVAGPRTLLISEPRGHDAIYHQFLKDASTFFMPLPTRDEVLLMWRHCFGGDVNDTAARKAVEERMDRWGPVPRYVLARVTQERRELEAPIAMQRVPALRDLVCTMDEKVAVNDVSFRVVHYNISDDCRKVTGYTWASPYVERRVLEVLEKREGADRFALLADMLASSKMIGMSHGLFESWSSHQMARGGTFRIRRLGVGSEAGAGSGKGRLQQSDDANSKLFEEADKLLGVKFDASGYGSYTITPAKATKVLEIAEDLPAASSFHNVRYSAKACFAAADFIETSGICSIATVQSQHELLLLGKNQRNGLLPILSRLQPGQNWTASEPNGTPPVPFLWLVPSVIFDECRAGVPVVETEKESEITSDAAFSKNQGASEGAPSAKQTKKGASQADVRAGAAALSDVDAAKALAPWVVQYAVEIPAPPDGVSLWSW